MTNDYSQTSLMNSFRQHGEGIRTDMTDVTLYDRDPNYIPRVAAVHDMCGYGKCSLTAAIPILIGRLAMCPVPTALFLGAHTPCSVHVP